MDLVIAAVVLNVHGVASRAIVAGYRLLFPFRDMPTLIWIKEKDGIFCAGESLVAFGQHGSGCRNSTMTAAIVATFNLSFDPAQLDFKDLV
jgi:hypothetical protein